MFTLCGLKILAIIVPAYVLLMQVDDIKSIYKSCKAELASARKSLLGD